MTIGHFARTAALIPALAGIAAAEHTCCPHHEHAQLLEAASLQTGPFQNNDQPVFVGREFRIKDLDKTCAAPTPAQRAVIQQIRADFITQQQLQPQQFLRIANRRTGTRSPGLTVEYILDAQVAANQPFVDALLLAADYWEATLKSEATLVVFVDFTSNQGFLAAASTDLYSWNYTSLRDATVAAASPQVATYVAALPTVMSYQKPSGPSDTSIDDSVIISDAVFQALGGNSINDPASDDAFIVFNTDFTFDTDPSDGNDPGTINLVYVMVHELGHALGFSSTVDTSLNNNFFNWLDMFRVGALGAFNDPSTLAEWTLADRELRPNVEAAIDPVGFFLGTVSNLQFSTGANNGDGRQASHWKDDALLGLNLPIGVMDPTYNGDQIPPGYITDADRLAYSLIGWNIDPVNCRWAPLSDGTDGAVFALASFDNTLSAGGSFNTAGGSSADNIAQWDGSAWSTLGSGTNGPVNALTSYDSGSGNELIAGGAFTNAGASAANALARWNGAAWSPLGAGVNNSVEAFAEFNGDLYIGGTFTSANAQPAQGLARWNGSQLTPINNGPSGSVFAMTVYNNQLIVAGDIEDPANNPVTLARFDGVQWSYETATNFLGTINALAVFNADLYIGGNFDLEVSGQPVAHLATWNAVAFGALPDAPNNPVESLATLNDGDGEALYLGGAFTAIGPNAFNFVAEWDGASFAPLWTGANASVRAFALFDDGTTVANSVHAAGDFTAAGSQVANTIAQWGCSNWVEPPPPSGDCPGDIDGDNTVNLADFNILAVNFGAGPGATLALGDLSGDGFVDLADFNILAVNFGNTCN